MIALTLALYLTLYLALIVAYVSVLKHMAEKPVEDLSRPVRLPASSPWPRPLRRAASEETAMSGSTRRCR